MSCKNWEKSAGASELGEPPGGQPARGENREERQAGGAGTQGSGRMEPGAGLGTCRPCGDFGGCTECDEKPPVGTGRSRTRLSLHLDGITPLSRGCLDRPCVAPTRGPSWDGGGGGERGSEI